MKTADNMNLWHRTWRGRTTGQKIVQVWREIGHWLTGTWSSVRLEAGIFEAMKGIEGRLLGLQIQSLQKAIGSEVRMQWDYRGGAEEIQYWKVGKPTYPQKRMLRISSGRVSRGKDRGGGKVKRQNWGLSGWLWRRPTRGRMCEGLLRRAQGRKNSGYYMLRGLRGMSLTR